MKQIFMKPWLEFHGRTKVLSTDRWYLDFANKLYSIIDASSFLPEDSVEDKEYLAIALATYFEDCVGYDGSGFPHFREMYHKRYGKYLPFYEVSENYILDEINFEDVCFLLWSSDPYVGSICVLDVVNPFDEELLRLAREIYDFMGANFEEAPIVTLSSRDWVIDAQYMEKDLKPMAEVKLGEKVCSDVDAFLQATGGYPLKYFGDYEELKPFLIHVLVWPEVSASLQAELEEAVNIVLYANAKGLIIAPFVGWYFKDSQNEFYDEEMTAEAGYSLFSDQGLCPFDLLKYAMAHDLIPDTAFPFENGQKLLHDNWEFIARWFLREYFEPD